jgi:N-methylhydantoinase A
MAVDARQHARSVSVDVGGTFTDVVSLDPATGELLVGKSPTTASAPADGIIKALDEIGVSLSEAQRFVHGTTLAINTLLERRGAVVGFITTAGLRDILEIGDASWPPYRLTWTRPTPLVPRRMCREASGRIAADGSVIDELDVDAVVREAQDLVRDGVDAIAICFINGYAYPQHERQAVEALVHEGIAVPVVASHQISRRYREYPRAVTAIAEAYLRPKMQHYFDQLRRGSEASGFEGRLFITSSDAGVMGIAEAREHTLRTLVSGCASGVAGAAAVGRSQGWNNIIAIDMGGTSFDAGIVQHGKPAMRINSRVEGFEFQTPMVELATIGAGGGSIAWVDDVGALNVGPQSAGAEPGPACYGRGGTDATFTDAALVSGLLPDTLLDGRMRLDVGLATEAVERGVGLPLSLGLLDAASGIVSLIEAKMARTIEDITIGKGFDPRDFVLFAYGGSGPLVAAVLAQELSVPTVVVPPHPGVFSAWGMQTLDIVHDFSLTLIEKLPTDEGEKVEIGEFADLLLQADEALAREGIQAEDRTLLRSIEMRYDGQEHTLEIPVDGAAQAPNTGDLRARFTAQHQAAYGFALDDAVEIVGCRVRAVGRLPKVNVDGVRDAEGSGSPLPAPESTRTVTHRASGAAADTWAVYKRAQIRSGDRVDGPAIVEELTATTLVPPDWTITRDQHGNLVLTPSRS